MFRWSSLNNLNQNKDCYIYYHALTTTLKYWHSIDVFLQIATRILQMYTKQHDMNYFSFYKGLYIPDNAVRMHNFSSCHCEILLGSTALLLLTYFYILAVCRFKKNNNNFLKITEVEIRIEEKAQKTMSLPKE